MKGVIKFVLLLALVFLINSCTESNQIKTEFGLVLHGGAG